MTLIKTEALVLHSIPFQESSSIVRIFTREQGKISVIAKGARRLKSSLRGLLEPLNHLEVIYYFKSTRDIQTLSKVDLIRSFLTFATDIETDIWGLALLETVDHVVQNHQYDHEIFDLAVAFLAQMDDNPELVQLIYIRFLLALTKTLGYRIGVDNCARCQRKLTAAIYDPENAQLICCECGKYFPPESRLNERELAFLKNRKDVNADSSIRKSRLVNILIHYLSYHLDIRLKLKSLQILPEISI